MNFGFKNLLLFLNLISSTLCASCNLMPAMSEAAGPDLGFIMIPGAQIPGDKYIPLAEEIQRQMVDKARVWVGITKVRKFLFEVLLNISNPF